jgi:hypothetical protein
MRAGRALEEARRAADGAKGAHRRIHATGNDPLGALVERFIVHVKSLP